MRKLGLLLLLLTSLLYPFAVYAGLGHARPAALAALLAASWLLRLFGWSRSGARPWLLGGLSIGYCCLLAWHPWPGVERWYPALVNLALALGFAASLHHGPSAIERLARLNESDLPPEAVAYTRKVTWVWLLFFIVNGSIAGALSQWGSLHWWALYNGGLTYLAMGLLFAGEYCLRRRVRRQHQPG
ncbi:COG4648 family protein [Frateuria aurantia]